MMSLNRTEKNRKKSFTLIEIVTALAILAVGMISILALFPVGFQASGRAANYIKAALYAQEKLEEIKMKGYDSAADEDEEPIEDDEKYSREVNVEPVDDFEDSLKEVIVTIKWNEQGKPREKEFKTYIANYAP